jgi:hypothetical protein
MTRATTEGPNRLAGTITLARAGLTPWGSSPRPSFESRTEKSSVQLKAKAMRKYDTRGWRASKPCRAETGCDDVVVIWGFLP